jgi:cell division protease FtsH
VGASRSHSEHTARLIDDEIRKLLEESYNTAKSILEREKRFLLQLSEALLEVETLDREEMAIIYECAKRQDSVVSLGAEQ